MSAIARSTGAGAPPRAGWRGHRSTSAAHRLAWSLLLLGATVLAAVAWQARAVLQERQQASQRWQQRPSAQAAPVALAAPVPPKAPDGAALRVMAQQREAVSRLNTPWSDIFDQLEASLPPQVAIVSIEPDARQVLQIRAEARDLDTLLAYAQALQERGVFGALDVRRHETNQQDGNRPARLSFELALRPLASGASGASGVAR